MEIEVGEYIRTDDGYVRKVIQVNKKGTYDALCHGAYTVDIKYKNSVGISFKRIKAHSKNIIDLIEVGDIIKEDKHNEPICRINNIEMLDRFKNGDNIKSIITKEQFKEIEYKVRK